MRRFKSAKNLLQPDITFLAYVSPDLAIKRIKNRPEEARRHLDEEQLKKVAAGFYALAKKERFCVIDTSVEAENAFTTVKNKIDTAVVL